MKRFDLGYFRDVYHRADDPWQFETSWYEQRKYSLTLAALPRERYVSAFEPGCSIGVLSERLAPRCSSLTCYELVPEVAERARRRVAHLPHVRVEPGSIPADWPSDSLDLVVLSEVVYYLQGDDFTRLVERLRHTLAPGGHVVAVHYRPETDYPLTGDEAHARLASALAGERHLSSYTEESFRLDVFERVRA